MKSLKILPIVLSLTLLTARGQNAAVNNAGTNNIEYISQLQICDLMTINEEVVALAEAPDTPRNISMPEASGTATEQNDRAVIDYSNTADGYVMVKFTDATSNKLKVQIARETTYTYDLGQGEWVTFPLSDGNGEYNVTVYESIVDNKYATVLAASFNVTLNEEFAPFVRPNQYVNYADAPNTIQKAQELAGGTDDVLEKVANIYEFVVNHLTYDKEKARTVQSGYLPDLDAVLAGDKGICFDYASLMTGMLRSQGVPCKLVVGYAGTVYHAWISVWSEETGWVDGVIYFDGTTWQRMDPTFISSGKGSASIQNFVGDGNNYTPKFLY